MQQGEKKTAGVKRQQCSAVMLGTDNLVSQLLNNVWIKCLPAFNLVRLCDCVCLPIKKSEKSHFFPPQLIHSAATLLLKT